MGLWSWFTGENKQVDKITDAVINGVDALVFTEEEKSKDSMNRANLWYKFMELSRDETSIKSVTRRILAFAIIGHWFLFIDIGVVMLLLGNQEAAKTMFTLTVDLLWLVAPVGSFYFGAGVMNKFKNKS